MMKFRSRPQVTEDTPTPNTLIGVGSSIRGTLMVSGMLLIDGDFEGDILNCERLEIGEHGHMHADIEVRDAVIRGRMDGNIRALGVVEMKSGARIEGDVTAMSVIMEAGVHFTGRCTMLDASSEGVEMGMDGGRIRETVRG
jgi:cytoskeletal protein CcmA (bactofilin family)